MMQTGLLLPHLVFIFWTKARSTLTDRCFSNFATIASIPTIPRPNNLATLINSCALRHCQDDCAMGRNGPDRRSPSMILKQLAVAPKVAAHALKIFARGLALLRLQLGLLLLDPAELGRRGRLLFSSVLVPRFARGQSVDERSNGRS